MKAIRASTRTLTLSLGAALLVAGCSARAGDGSGTPAEKRKPLPATEPTGDAPEFGPRHPEQGKWYPYDMYTHCGIGYADFGGRTWQLETVHTNTETQVAGERPGGGNFLRGYMALLGPDEASFEAAGLPPMSFTPAKGKPPTCA